MPLEITFAPTRLNIHEAESVIERARVFGAFRFNTGKLMRVGRAARLWSRIAPSEEAYEKFQQVLRRPSRLLDHTMQICHVPFTLAEGLRQSLDTPPATMLVLPNGWVKIVSALGYICGDLRRITLSQAWEKYRAAWHDETVVAAIRRGISDESFHADANVWKSIPNGVMEACST
jgi:MoaA/NifB/PqqE/SkfB family radical SAM enzyme